VNTVWFTSDEHYSHSKIIRLMNRPFGSVEEMNEKLIENHNSFVMSGDRVYHLGDFAWNNAEIFLRRLNGQHFLIRGNHDYRDVREKGFIWVKDAYQLTVWEHTFWLSHYAHRVWPRSHFGSFHLHGHSHGMLDAQYGLWGRSMDVGVDAPGMYYSPINVEEVINILKDREFKNHHPE